MGFWNKVKEGFTQMTGGGGNMQIVLQNPKVKRGESLNVTITLNATAPLTGKSVNVEVTGTETDQVPGTGCVHHTRLQYTGQPFDDNTVQRAKRRTTRPIHTSVPVDGAVSMQAGETKTLHRLCPDT